MDLGPPRRTGPRGRPFVVGQVKCDGTDKNLATRVAKKLRSADALRTELAPAALRVDLATHLRARWNQGSVSVGDLWDWFTRYPYLVRLHRKSVLTHRLLDVLHDPAWTDRGFALATGIDDTSGDFLGLAVPLEDSDFGPVVDTTLLVKPELAIEQRAREQNTHTEPDVLPAPGGDGGQRPRQTGDDEWQAPPSTPPDKRGTTPVERRTNVRWSGRFDLDPGGDIEAELAGIAREVIEALRRGEPDVLEISVSISADKFTGFDTGTVRTVSENSNSLGGRDAGFEDA